MEKFLVTIEFRYVKAPNVKCDYITYPSKTITLGVFDTRDEANECGNKALEIFEKRFKLNPNYNRHKRFSNNGGCFGSPNDLITDYGYILTPFSFFAKITKLKYDDVDQTITEVLNDVKEYQDYKKNQNESD